MWNEESCLKKNRHPTINKPSEPLGAKDEMSIGTRSGRCHLFSLLSDCGWQVWPLRHPSSLHAQNPCPDQLLAQTQPAEQCSRVACLSWFPEQGQQKVRVQACGNDVRKQMKLLVEKQLLDARDCNQKTRLKPVHNDCTSALLTCEVKQMEHSWCHVS